MRHRDGHSQLTRVLLLFLDGVGLGEDEPSFNPLAAARLPALASLIGGQRLVAGLPRLETERATFIPTDAIMGVDGLPQSATGQATILTGHNVPREVGGHWGPKPNAAVAESIQQFSLFRRLRQAGRRAALLNAYPQGYFDQIASGQRMYSAVSLAVTSAGLPLMTADDLYRGRALSADFTGEAWRQRLGYADAPVRTPADAGRHLAHLASQWHFAFFEYWPTDYAGHRATLAEGVALLERLDAVLGGLLEAWDDSAGLVVMTSDHGNLEDLRTRHHTRNPVPTLVIGAAHLRATFTDGLSDLTGFAPAVLRTLGVGPAA